MLEGIRGKFIANNKTGVSEVYCSGFGMCVYRIDETAFSTEHQEDEFS